MLKRKEFRHWFLFFSFSLTLVQAQAQTISFSPNSGYIGSSFKVTVTGDNTLFNDNPLVLIAASPTSIILTNIVVNSNTELTGDIMIPANTLPDVDTAYVLTSLNVYSCNSCFTFAPCTSVVNSQANLGVGSLRGVIGCVVPGTTVTFDPILNSQMLSVDLPAIEVNKTIMLSAQPGSNITMTASNINNTQSLFDITQPLTISGLKLEGNTSESLIFEVSTGGSVNLDSTEINRVIINN